MRISVSVTMEDHKAAHFIGEAIVEVADDRDPNGAIQNAVIRLLRDNTVAPKDWSGRTVIEIERMVE